MVHLDRPERCHTIRHHRCTVLFTLLVAFTLSGVACGSDEYRTAETHEVDSAGIRVVESPGPRHSEKMIEFPVVVVAGSDTVPFTRIADVIETAEGGLAVADNGPEVVWLFDRDGAPIGHFGGRGGGPGELDRIIGLHSCDARGRIAVVTPFTIHLYTATGEFEAGVPYRTGGEQVVVVGLSADCKDVLLQERVTMPPIGEVGATEDRFKWRRLGDVQGDREVARARLLEAWIRGLRGEVRPFLLPWGTSRSTVTITQRDGIVIGQGRRAALHVMAQSGRVDAIVRWMASAAPVTYRDRRRYERDRQAWLSTVRSDPEADLLFPALSSFPWVFDQKPIFDQILAGPDETIWVRSFPDGSYGLFDSRLRDPPRVAEKWSVMTAEGTWLYDVTLPAAFELRDVGLERLFGVLVDSLGVQEAAVMARPSMASR